MTAAHGSTSAASAIVDLCVVGGGDAGYSAALAGVALGLRVVLVTSSTEDPSRRNWDVALSVLRRAGLRYRFGSGGSPPFAAELGAALEAAAPDRRFARLGAMNIRVMVGRARFIGRSAIEVSGTTIRARRFVLATGARATAGVLGGDHLFDRLRRSDPLRRARIVGGDPRSVAMAQSLCRLGTEVRLDTPDGLLPGLDPELVEPLRSTLERDGVRLRSDDDWPTVHAVETVPEIVGLGLEAAGIAVRDGRIVLSDGLRTTNRHVYAVGGVAGAASSAAAQAQIAAVMKSAFFRLPVRFEPHLIPIAVVTEPEIASVGLGEATARARGPVDVLRWPLAESALGAAEGAAGHLKIIADRHGRVLGAGVVGPGAADMIGFWTQAIRLGTSLQRLADVALPCPSSGEASRRLIVQHAASRLRSPWVKRTLRMLSWLG